MDTITDITDIMGMDTTGIVGMGSMDTDTTGIVGMDTTVVMGTGVTGVTVDRRYMRG